LSSLRAIHIRVGSCDSQATKMFTHITSAANVLLLVESAQVIVRANNFVREPLHANKKVSNDTNKFKGETTCLGL
jgi:hypothetical protein